MPETNETALEQTFSDLAYSHLRDKSQALLDYLVGFQMLKQEEDGQRAVGIFGFEIGGDYYYAPAFFLNGEIRGLDSLYSVKSDLFVPLTDGWVGSIIDQRDVSLGDPDTRSRSERGIHVPNYSRMKVIPGGGGSINLKLAEVMMGERGDRVSAVDLVTELQDAGVAGQFKTALDQSQTLRDHFTSFGYNVFDLSDAPEPKLAQAEEAVVIINSITDEGVEELTDEQREDVLAGGTTVIDKRPEVEKSQVFRTETNEQLSNPDGGGLYDVLWGDGAVSVALVVPSNTLKNCMFVYREDDDKYVEIASDKIHVLRKYSRQELIDWLDKKGMKPSEVRPGSVVVFVSSDGEGTGGFCIDENNTGLDNITTLCVNDRHYMSDSRDWPMLDDRGDNGNPPHNTFMDLRLGGNGDHDIMDVSNRPGDPNCRVKHILVPDVGAGAPRYTEQHLIVNDKCFWALKINSFRMVKDRDGAQFEHEEYGEPNYDAQLCCKDFGNYNTVQEALNKVANDLKVWRQNGETTIKLGSAQSTFRKEADGLRLLMRGLECGEADARAILKEAGLKPSTWKFRPNMKVAAELLDLPEIEDTDLGGFMTSYQPEQIPFVTVNQARSPQNREFYQYYSPFGSGAADAEDGGQGTFETLDAAGKTGQKDVFDAAALGSLIKSHNPTELVDRFLPTITAGMDRIGRMLFLIYWHYEDFEDRYGDNDLSEFIDNLRAVFEQIGDIVIFAKKRTLAGDPEHFGMGAAPVIEEAS